LAGYGVNIINVGLGSTPAKLKMYNFANDEDGGLATLYKSALSDLFNAENVVEVEVNISTLDEFCKCKKIEFIDFLKIDVEGHELAVFQGAKTMIQNNKIDFIQFEFNKFNIISRVFLKDFYEILSGYNLYRIKNGSLIPILEYKSINEIFEYQNILAIRKEIETEKF
jgi:FkbM family methyltransferase